MVRAYYVRRGGRPASSCRTDRGSCVCGVAATTTDGPWRWLAAVMEAIRLSTVVNVCSPRDASATGPRPRLPSGHRGVDNNGRMRLLSLSYQRCWPVPPPLLYEDERDGWVICCSYLGVFLTNPLGVVSLLIFRDDDIAILTVRRWPLASFKSLPAMR